MLEEATMISGKNGQAIDTQPTRGAAPEFIPLDSDNHQQNHTRSFRRSADYHRYRPAGAVAPGRPQNGKYPFPGHNRTKRKRESQADANAPYHIAWPVVGHVPAVDSENMPPNDLEVGVKPPDEDDGPQTDRSQGNVAGIADFPISPSERNIWNLKGKVYSNNVIGLHEEIEDFFQWMVPTKMEHDTRIGVLNRIRSLIRSMWPDAKVDIFGSFKTGLYLPTSDIDLVVSGKWQTLPLHTLRKELEASGIPRLDNLLLLDKAAVPIVKMTDEETGIKVDISFNTVNGIRAAELIKFYKKTFPPLAKLIYVLKQFLLQRGLNEVFLGGLSSYALILMAVSFLQLHQRPDAKQHNTNLGVLLIEFFELYGRNFNYAQTAISLRDGGCYLPREQMIRNMPHLANHSTGVTLCIEDPLDASNDVGKGSFFFHRVKESFEDAYTILTKLLCSGTPSETSTKSILNHIISVSDDVKDFRCKFAEEAKEPAGTASKPAANKDPPLSSDVPLTPVYMPRSPSSNVTPHDLPDRHFHADKEEAKGEPMKETFKVPEDPPVKEVEENIDNMSGVSTATVSIASSCCDSDSSPSSGLNSDMSISPANSEIESKFKVAQKSSVAVSYSSSRRHLRTSQKKRPGRADLDPDWRSSGGVSSESSDGGSSFKHERRRMGSGDTNSDSNSPPRQQHRADQDPDWRNHKDNSPSPTPLTGQWRFNRLAVRNQYCAPGEKSSAVTAGKEKRPPGFAATAVQMAPPSPSQGVSEDSIQNAQQNDNQCFANCNLASKDIPVDNENFVTKKKSPAKLRTKKLKKSLKSRNRTAVDNDDKCSDNNANSDSSSDFNASSVPASAAMDNNRRFSCVQGPAKGKR